MGGFKNPWVRKHFGSSSELFIFVIPVWATFSSEYVSHNGKRDSSTSYRREHRILYESEGEYVQECVPEFV